MSPFFSDRVLKRLNRLSTWAGFALVATSGLLSAQTAADAYQPTVAQLRMDHSQITRLWLQPDGLQKLADRFGTFVVSSRPDYIYSGKLKDMVGCKVILTGTVTGIQSDLEHDPDDINTTVTVRPDQILKGASNGDLQFVVHGGIFHYPEGTTAVIKTNEWEYLQIGERYLLFLDDDGSSGEYSPRGGVEGMFHVVRNSGLAEPLALKDGQDHAVLTDTKGTSLVSLVFQIQQLLVKK